MDVVAKYSLKLGFSDHTKGIGVSISSINYGACLIEKHFMLTNKKSLDSEFSSDHLEMEKLVKEINNSWHAIGAVKNDISKSEKIYRKYRRSIYSIKNIKKGNKLSEENIRIIRPGLGMEPRFISKVLVSTREVSGRNSAC